MCQRSTHTTLIFLLLISICGCSGIRRWWHNGLKLGPNYGAPLVPVADDWIESGNAAVVITQDERADWWRVFNDATLDKLILAAYRQNVPLRVAGLRVLEARAQRAITAANLFPQSQQLFGQFTRTRLSRRTATASPIGPVAFDDWQTGFDLSWEIDVWGRLRRAIESSDAALDAEIENYDDLLVTLIGDVAATYIEIRSFDERIRLAEKNVETQQGSLNITKTRLREGDVSELDVQQATANLTDTRASIPSLRQGRRQALNRLAILLGKTPYDIEPLLRDGGTIPGAPQEAIVGIPAELLRRRPDVRSAERFIAAQSAQIGIAEAELYPQFAINGEIQLNAEDFSDLFKSSSQAGMITPGFRWNILNYGRLVNNVRVQELRFLQEVGNYENVVLSAHREVEDAIALFLRSKERAIELQKSVDAATRSVELVQIQYKEGETDFNQVFVLEANLVQAQDNLVLAKTDIAIGLTQVYKALGGGWQLRLDVPYCEPVNPEMMLNGTEPSIDSDKARNGVEGDGEFLLPLPAGPETGSGNDNAEREP